MKVRVDGQVVVSTEALLLIAAMAGFGLAYLSEKTDRGCILHGEINGV